MFLTVKSISVIYSPINQDNTFTNGDFISGQVILDVAKETEMQSLSIKIKGKADVQWSEHYGKTTVVYSDKEKFYSMERFFVREDKSHGNDHELLKDPSGQAYSSVVAPGRHVYPFVFQLPQQNYPPSFKGSAGKIVYTLMTKLCRSLRVSSKAAADFHYVPKPDLQNPELLAPQYGTIDKQMKLFTSGSVAMNLKTEKTGYYLDEGLKVLAEIQNNSSRAIKPKYYLYEKHSFLAKGKRRIHTHDILKEEGEPIEQKTNKNVTKVLTIPPSLSASIFNCRIIKVEYRLRVCLDVPYASDPEIKFPIVLLPPQTTSGAKCPSNSDFGIWNQQAGGSLYPNTPPMAPGQFGASGNYGPSPGQFGTPGNSGPSGQYAAPGYVGPLSQFAPPGYPGPPAQLHPPVSNFQQSDASALPPYQDYQLYPHIPDETKKS
ncbi:arrestin domain-containing protein 3-like [Triplophysa dalaica]|uniref:arrestin domain-containing protein 3-like n=1 Tax=Triplophysa dalaica TaxID=1582913 RepID=UPI0024DFEC08|nr:arrestin domain-containing protein 3-like [Triplophysa dalaica]